MTEHTTTLPDGRRLLATHQGHNTVGWVVHIAGAEGRRFRLLGGLSSHAITRCAPVSTALVVSVSPLHGGRSGTAGG
jgi:hypothetical protein